MKREERLLEEPGAISGDTMEKEASEEEDNELRARIRQLRHVEKKDALEETR